MRVWSISEGAWPADYSFECVLALVDVLYGQDEMLMLMLMLILKLARNFNLLLPVDNVINANVNLGALSRDFLHPN